MKAVLAFDLGEEFVADLRASFPEVAFVTAYSEEEQLAQAPDAEIFFGTISREAFLAAARLKWYQYIGIGFDTDLLRVPELRDSPVVMTVNRETHVVPIADHVFAMILSFAHCIPGLIEDQKARRWDPHKWAVTELAGSTMGVLAMGDIGRAVARRAQGFDMEVYAVDIAPMEPPPGVREVWGPERLDDLLKISDWFVVTAPRTPQTEGLIDARRFGIMKPGAHLIVVSRGGIVDEEALAAALASGEIAGAGCDALWPEPPAPDSPLWDLPNMLISPHSSAHSPQMWERRRQIFKENLGRYLAGEPLRFVCDRKRGY